MNARDAGRPAPSRLRPCALTVVAPVYRNAASLAELAQRIHAALDPVVPDHLVLMVDDASPDESWQILGRLCREDGRLAAARLEANVGQQRALLTGLALADSTWVAILDADLQDPPEVLRALYDEAQATGGLVFAERHGQYESWGRMLASILFKSLVGLVSGLPRRCGTFFVAPRAVAERVLGLPAAIPQLPIMARIAAGRIATLPFVRPRRPQGESAYDFRHRLQAAWDGLRCAVACRLAGPAVTPVRPRARIAAFLGQGWAE